MSSKCWMLAVCAWVLLGVAGCADYSVVITDCEVVGDKVPLCDWQRPEDMELLDDGKTLLVSQMEAGHGTIAGALALLDTTTDTKRPLTILDATDELWGQSDCTVAVTEQMGPHGIHLSTRVDGRQQLLVVNHGARESVEMFEVQALDEGYQLQWRGCVTPPAGSFLNDVVALPAGGFVVTHMFTKSDSPVGTLNLAELKALFGFNPGHLLHWDGVHFARLGGFTGDYPNGLQISADGRYLFVNLWAESKMKKLDSQTAEVLAEVEVTHPDNSQWDGAGRLLVTGHDFSLNDLRVCTTIESGTCPGAFEIMVVDTEAMSAERVMRLEGPPMGAGTVTQRVGGKFYIGSFLGDRILTVPAP